MSNAIERVRMSTPPSEAAVYAARSEVRCGVKNHVREIKVFFSFYCVCVCVFFFFSRISSNFSLVSRRVLLLTASLRRVYFFHSSSFPPE